MNKQLHTSYSLNTLPLKIWWILLSIYYVIKANYMSIGHDEAGTMLNIIPIATIDYFTNELAWADANNHLLNTLSIKAILNFLPNTPFVIRLPNVLAGIVYGWFTIKLAQVFCTNVVSSILLFVLLNATAYQTDFFCLARGYGLCMAAALGAFYYSVCYYITLNKKYLYYLGIAYILLVMANFTGVQFIAVNSLWLLVFVVVNKKQAFIALSIITIIPVIAFSNILLWLSKKGEFLWGNTALIDTYRHYRSDLIYNASAEVQSRDVINILFVMYITLLIVAIINIVMVRSKKLPIVKLYTLLLPLTLVLMAVVLKFTAGALYPDTRKVLIFYPFIAISIYAAIDYFIIRFNNNFIAPIVSTLVIITQLTWWANNVSIYNNREWWFSSGDNKVWDVIKKDTAKNTVAMHWMLMPAMEYARVTTYNNVAPFVYNKNVDTTTGFKYYYTFDSELPLLSNKYKILTIVRPGVVLLQKRQ